LNGSFLLSYWAHPERRVREAKAQSKDLALREFLRKSFLRVSAVKLFESEPMLIRNATVSDLSQIMALASSSATAARWSEPRYKGLLDGQVTVPRIFQVLEDDGVVRGFIIARVVADECELENIVVEEASRRRGLATRLLAALFDWAAKSRVQAVFLEVRASNAVARALYEKCGFRQTGKRPRYYHDPEEDAILYSYAANPVGAVIVKRD
jgi:[ribosomal protein S18]-alanine N-acetyltransferase